MATFEEILARDGRLVYTFRGVSMLPLLRQNRDIVIIEPPKGRLRKYDIALYRRGTDHVLHRVVRVREHGYDIRGDNTYRLEDVPDDAVIGVLTGFSRAGRTHKVDEIGYKCYARLWCAVYPLRYLWQVIRWRMIVYARRLGLRRGDK